VVLALMHPQQPMAPLIAFEGVDGAGKSTVLERLAQRLRGRGHRVHRPRIGKRHHSRPARAIRDLTRDLANLELCPRAELALYCAREAQVLSESVIPALARGEIVLLDRGLLTPVVLGSWGRGLPLADCEAMARAARGEGPVPTLTLVFDVELRTARQRKQIAKVRAHGLRDGGRKGVAGSGFKARIRAGYRALAADDPSLRLIVSERDEPELVVERVLAILAGARAEPERDAQPWWRVEAGVDLERELDAALDGVPEALAIYLSRGLVHGRARRAAARSREPALVAWALDPDDPLRESMVGAEPGYALAGLRGRPLTREDLREAQLEVSPIAVAHALAGVGGDAADQLRQRLLTRIPSLADPEQRQGLAGGLLASLAGREDTFATELRTRWWAEADSDDQAASLQGCGGRAVERLRAELFERDPARALVSLRDVGPSLADRELERYAELAPKLVLRALHGRDDRGAWALREALAATGSELVESLVGLADPRSHALRRAALREWPLGVLASLRGVPITDPEHVRLWAALGIEARTDLELCCALLRA
jgi:dTMP kinase